MGTFEVRRRLPHRSDELPGYPALTFFTRQIIQGLMSAPFRLFARIDHDPEGQYDRIHPITVVTRCAFPIRASHVHVL